MMQFKHVGLDGEVEVAVTLHKNDLHISEVHDLYIQFLRGVGYVVREEDVLEYVNENLKDYSAVEYTTKQQSVHRTCLCHGECTFCQYANSVPTDLTSEGLALR